MRHELELLQGQRDGHEGLPVRYSAVGGPDVESDHDSALSSIIGFARRGRHGERRQDDESLAVRSASP